MIKIALYFLLWWLLVAVAIFATQNLQSVSISFLAWQSINLPVGLALVFCAGFGAMAVTFLQVLNQSLSQTRNQTAQAYPNPTKSGSKATESANKSSRKNPNYSSSSKNKTASKSVPKSDSKPRNQESRVQDAPRSNSPVDYNPQPKSVKENDWETRINDWDNW